MRQFVLAAFALGAFVGVVAMAEPAKAECVVVRATADARNPQVSTERSQDRLQRYIARKLASLTGKSIGPVSTHCIRNACESSAIVCHH